MPAPALEQALEPELEIVDPHHHLWDFETEYGRYEIEELRHDTGAGHNIVQTVFVECNSNLLTDGPEHLRFVGETEYVERRASVLDQTAGAKIAGIVATADLRHPAAADTLDAHGAASSRFRGIRQRLNREDGGTPSLYNDPAFHAGCRELASRGHTLDAWQYHFQLADLVSVAKAVPELTIVINHLGGPLGRGEFAGQRDGDQDRPGRARNTRERRHQSRWHRNGTLWHRMAAGRGSPLVRRCHCRMGRPHAVDH